MSTIDTLIHNQEELIAAVLSGNVADIEDRTAKMAETVAALKQSGIDFGGIPMDRLAKARSRNVEAAKRVNSMTHRTREKLDRINELRGNGTALDYSTY